MLALQSWSALPLTVSPLSRALDFTPRKIFRILKPQFARDIRVVQPIRQLGLDDPTCFFVALGSPQSELTVKSQHHGACTAISRHPTRCTGVVMINMYTRHNAGARSGYREPVHTTLRCCNQYAASFHQLVYRKPVSSLFI